MGLEEEERLFRKPACFGCTCSLPGPPPSQLSVIENASLRRFEPSPAIALTVCMQRITGKLAEKRVLTVCMERRQRISVTRQEKTNQNDTSFR